MQKEKADYSRLFKLYHGLCQPSGELGSGMSSFMGIAHQDCMHCILMLHNQYCFVQHPWHALSFMYLWGIKYITQKASSVRDTASFSIKQSREDWWGRDKDNTEKGSEEWFWYIVVVIQSPGGSKHTYVSIHPIDSKFGLKVDELILSPATNRPI